MARGVRTYKSEEDALYEMLAWTAAFKAKPTGWEPIVGPVRLEIAVYQRVSKSSKTAWSITKPDLSNVVKSIEDALLGLAYEDDRQVAEIEASKWECAKDKEPYVLVNVMSCKEK
jgi:Holliday junction resolvase RusA-like endonuclease